MRRTFTLLLLLNCLLSYAQVNLNLGLRAYYPFSGNANDASGNNNNPVFNNATLTSDQYGNANSAYHFNGLDNYMLIPNSPTLNMGSAISICAKVRATGFYLGQCQNNMMLAKADGDFISGTYSLRFADPLLGCTSNPPTTNEVFYGGRFGGGAISPAPFVNLNQWYTVVVTDDGTVSKIYVDCILRATTASVQNPATGDFDLYLGHLNNSQYPYWLNGDLDEVRIYDRAINEDEVNAYGGCQAITSCNNWLNTTSYPSYVRVGDLDITGNTVTVEANINRTDPYLPGGGDNSEGDIVSKHTDPPNVNYLLRPNHAYITTTNGFFGTPDVCEIELNKTYHVAMVYDGTTLKYYRNGFLMSQVAATGNLIQSNINTQIGLYDASFYSTQFLGYINEVRIWNVARSQAQIQAYMNSSLPNPTTQTGLLAYYTFDNLINKQGNTTWNGTITGAATINATNSSCIFLPDSCNGILPVTLTDFKATVIDNKKIELSWNTENELNINDYSVQRSTTGYEPDYITIGAVSPKGNSHSIKYRFTDNTARPNTLYYYKLRINDHDGSTKASPIRTAKIVNNKFYTIVYPNPTTGILKLSINNATADVYIKVTNDVGQLITEKKISATDSNSFLLDISNLSKGFYWVTIQSGENKFVEKLVKL
ncbi:MAG: LamG-like jellyroll fold domain-containing protein [Ferruginibacter sp.]